MNLFSLLSTIAIVFVLNSFFQLLPWLLPRLGPNDVLPYQMWGNAMLLFYFILPSTSGDDFFKTLKPAMSASSSGTASGTSSNTSSGTTKTSTGGTGITTTGTSISGMGKAKQGKGGGGRKRRPRRRR